MKIGQPDIRRLIALWFQKNALCEGWQLLLLMHLKDHGVPTPQAIEAMERFVYEVIAIKSAARMAT
ncbi:hypothetical protein [Bradyrhizobium japonicum]|uniref:hypothetical protein n=1 Tax=Bradyrhizobium japonicum TaxID=375 RepID=UPI0027147AD4|nr:hypothetical protein [Bradyrhizobium japonicum]WLB57488.1 hypothetical protein QIH94_16300 [Bradyrhizobium japonicum]WLB60646.1 hypothetical protein QIH96_29650 [Bradyrhizobium japonicum]